jgi:glycosyltransferase involved in cell wall biosynthesis
VTGPLKFLFVPVSGPGGAGEYYRSLAVARAVERRWPACRIQFVLSRDARYGGDSPYPVLYVERSPTFETAAVVAILERERPDVVVFDSAGRAMQYRRAKELGAGVVFVSSRATTRRKGFRFRRMRWIDQHWVVAPRFAGGRLGVLERLGTHLAPGCEIVFLDVLHEPVDEAGAADLQRSLGVEPRAYLFACPGGGGVFGEGPDASQVFFGASLRLANRLGMPVVAVLGPRFAAPQLPPPGVHVLVNLPNAQLLGMLRDARLGIINGGSLLMQALSIRAPCVSAPIAEDQPRRIAECAARGYVRPAALDAASLAAEAEALIADEGNRAALLDRLETLDLRNGVDVAVDALARLVLERGNLVADAPRGAEPRLRIMQLILSRGFAGSERAVAEACNGMCDRHDVVLVIRSDHRSLGGASICDHLDPRVQVTKLPARIGTRRRLAAVIRSWRPDIIHTHLRRGTRYVAQIGAGAVHFCTLHLSLNGPHFLKSDGLFCISEWQLETVPTTYRGRLFLLRNSLVSQPRLDPARVRQLRAEFGASGDDFVVGGVGRLTQGKGFDVLIRAFTAAALPNARLVIVGEGRQRGRLERMAGANVALAGFRGDVKNLYQAFDLFVSPSRIEPFSRVIIEALDAGTPVVATNAQGPRDIARRFPIELVPVSDVAALAEALRRAGAGPRRRLALDLSEFNVQSIVARMLEAYTEVLAARSSSADRRTGTSAR